SASDAAEVPIPEGPDHPVAVDLVVAANLHCHEPTAAAAILLDGIGHAAGEVGGLLIPHAIAAAAAKVTSGPAASRRRHRRRLDRQIGRLDCANQAQG